MRPNMAAILCIPVVVGEAGKQARPERQLSMPVISRNVPQRSVLCIPGPRYGRREERREGLRAISLRTRGHDSGSRLGSARRDYATWTRRDEKRSGAMFSSHRSTNLPLSPSPTFHSSSVPLFSSLVFLFAAILTLQGAT